jgi:hypothetical protein
MKIDDVLVFIGKDVEDHHFKNFTYGKQYIIQNFFSELPEGDSLGQHTAIFFKNTNFGCLMSKVDKYFITLNEYRNIQLKELL